MVELERDRLERGRRKYSLNNAEFKELDHPRGEDGKFGSGGKLGEKEEKQKKFAKVLRKIGDDIRKGFSLSEAFQQHPGVFNPLYVALVQAGEVSGTLHTVLDELSDYLEKIEDTRRKVTSAMAYPMFILVFLIGVVVYIWSFFCNSGESAKA